MIHILLQFIIGVVVVVLAAVATEFLKKTHSKLNTVHGGGLILPIITIGIAVYGCLIIGEVILGLVK